MPRVCGDGWYYKQHEHDAACDALETLEKLGHVPLSMPARLLVGSWLERVKLFKRLSRKTTKTKTKAEAAE